MSKPFAVVDTSSLISFYLGRKSLAHMAVRLLTKTHDLLASQETLEEFREVIMREKFDRISHQLRLSYIEKYRQLITIVDPHITITACIDPKDDKFLSLAVSANASLLLTNDDHLLRLHPFQGIDILTPQQYLDEQAIPPGPR